MPTPQKVPRTSPPPASKSYPDPALPRWVPWFVLALALLLRLAWLDIKPPHFDEGVNGWFVDQMTKQGYYHYDPANYHGPFHFYVLFLAQTLFGRHVWALRLPLVLVNVATIWLVLHFQRFIPRRACIVAALAFAVSPGMLFYSRYAIHEAWFVLGQVLIVWGLAEMWSRGASRGLWASVMGVTLLVLTKETYIIHLAAFILAMGTLAILEWLIPSEDTVPLRPVPQKWNWFTLGSSLLLSLLLIVFFYSGGFLDFRSLYGLVQTFAAWFHTGMKGSGHEKPFWYWLNLIRLYEWPAIIGLLYSLRALFPRMNRLARFIAIYGCGTLVAYSAVPYKTPWCILSIVWPFLFLFGIAMDEWGRWLAGVVRNRWAAGAVAALVLGASLAASVRLNYFHPADPTEPYVYVQTMDDFFKLSEPLKRLIARDPAAYYMPGSVLLRSYHPLPWVLGDFTAIGYYDTVNGHPGTMDAGFLIVEPDWTAEVESKLKEPYFVEPFQLRDGMTPGKLYLNYARFAPDFPGRTPEFDPTRKQKPVAPQANHATQSLFIK